MVTLTDDAVSVIRGLTQQATEVPTAGIRIADDGDNSLGLRLVEAPQPGDTVVDVSGAKLFLDATAEEALDGKVLHAQSDSRGRLQFTVADRPDPMS
jgi:Fe-S cluster assembly iron-binding protein IscA